HHQNGNVFGLLDQACAFATRQADISDDEIEPFTANCFERFVEIACFTDCVIVVLEQLLECRADDLLVFDNENVRHKNRLPLFACSYISKRQSDLDPRSPLKTGMTCRAWAWAPRRSASI